MSNTVVRIISGFVLGFMALGCILYGTVSTLAAIGVLGFAVTDEILTNFFALPRASKRYALAQLTYVVGYWFFNFFHVSPSDFNFFISAGFVLNLIGMVYLFLINSKKQVLGKVAVKAAWLTGFVVLIPIMCMSFITQNPNWPVLVGCFLIMVFMVDTAAYFSGKAFGRHKLWEAVSPKKTVEGLIGGVIASVIATTFYWNHYVNQVTWPLVVFFLLLACCAQVGDLLQSKMKRQFEIKDSSSLIPGHGGVYDRIDSLLFVAPYYALLLSVQFH